VSAKKCQCSEPVSGKVPVPIVREGELGGFALADAATVTGVTSLSRCLKYKTAACISEELPPVCAFRAALCSTVRTCQE
jgi:hypothetical protein